MKKIWPSASLVMNLLSGPRCLVFRSSCAVSFVISALPAFRVSSSFFFLLLLFYSFVLYCVSFSLRFCRPGCMRGTWPELTSEDTYISPLLAVGATHHALIDAGVRMTVRLLFWKHSLRFLCFFPSWFDLFSCFVFIFPVPDSLTRGGGAAARSLSIHRVLHIYRV